MHDVAVDRLGNEHCGSVHATAICRLRIRNAGLATKATEEWMNGVPRDHIHGGRHVERELSRYLEPWVGLDEGHILQWVAS